MAPSDSMTLRILALARSLLCLPGKIASWLILPLVLTILLSVLAAIMGWSTLIDWEGELPLLGSALTVNSLLDLQWYSFALIVLFGGVWAFFEDRHVTVDFLALHFSPRARALISLFGDLFLLLPLFFIVLPLLRALPELHTPTPHDAALRHLSTRCELALALGIRQAVRGDATGDLERAQSLGILHQAPERLLLGRHATQMGVEPGPALGRVLEHVYGLQLDGVVTTHEQAVRAARDWLAARGPGPG